MYQEHFHLDQEPFSIAPDPSFLYLSTAHREALAHLMYGFSHGGFVLITGEVGTGKTTLLRNLLKQTPPELDVAFVLNPRLTVRELLETLCDELGAPYDAQATTTVKQFIDVLNRHLLKTHQGGRSTVVIIDEAQNLSPAVLEQVRLLTNLETDERKLLRIILVGQPELAELLARQELRQLAQRITARYHLDSLHRDDCYAYVAHRLSRAGGQPDIFTNGALRRLYRLSGGIPRIINVIADRSLLGTFAAGKNQVSGRIVNQAAREVLGRKPRRYLWAAAAAGISLGGIAWAVLNPPGSSSADGPPVRSTLTGSPAAPEQPSSTPATTNAPQPDSPGAAITTGELAPGSTAQAAPANATADEATTSVLQAAVAGPPGSTPTGEANPQAPPEPDPDSFAGPNPAPNPVLNTDPHPASNSTATTQPGTTPPAVEQSDEVDRPQGNTFTTQRQAYAAVFQLWGMDYETAPEDLIPCDFAPSAGLMCLSRRGNWNDVTRLNLPVVLELWDEQPNPYYGALTGTDAGQLRLSLGDRELVATRRALRDSWYGAYVVIWQTPPGYKGSIRMGDSHETVAWLRQQLAAFSNSTLITNNPNFFDADLQAAVLEFQQQEGLITDGIVGPATWIRLSGRLQLPAPYLNS